MHIPGDSSSCVGIMPLYSRRTPAAAFAMPMHSSPTIYYTSPCPTASSTFHSSYFSSRMPSLSTIFTTTPLKSIGSRLLSSSVHILKIFMPCSKLMSG